MAKEIGGNRYEYLTKSDKEYWSRGGYLYETFKNNDDKRSFLKILKEARVVKIGHGEISFITFYDWDNQLNPVIKAWYRFKRNTKSYTSYRYVYVGKRMNSKTNPFIIHRKEEFYQRYYYGRSEERRLSKEWTEFYENSGIPEFKMKNKIGRKVFWDAAVKKLIEKFPEEMKKFEGGINV